MRAVAFPRGIEWQKLLQFVISSNSIIAKRAFGVLCIIRKSNSYTDILHGHPRLKTFSNNEGKSLYSSEASDNLNNVPVVKAFVHSPDSSNNPVIAVYWDDSKKCNQFKEHRGMSVTKAAIEAVCLALKQAIFQLNLPRVCIITNSKIVYKHFGKMSLWWNLDGFWQQKSMTVLKSYSAEVDDLYRLLHMIDATIEYSSSAGETTKEISENSVSRSASEWKSGTILENKSIGEPSSFGAASAKLRKQNTDIFLPENSSSDSKNHASKNLLSGRSVPIVYTCGVLYTEGIYKKYVKAGCGVYWPLAEELSSGRRYNFYPVTLIRCQLQAIIDALKQAMGQNYRSIDLHTDCITFLVHHPRQWLKANGSYVRYHDQYQRIMDFCRNLKVRFLRADNLVALDRAKALAENGVCLPVPCRRSLKKMHDSRTLSISNAKYSL